MKIRVDGDWVENKDANALGQCVLNRNFLTNGNSKKGADVLSAAIARPKGGCPFSTPVCRENCYFGTGQHLFHAERYEQNLKFTDSPEFVPTLSTEIVRFAEHNAGKPVSVCVHEGGELYSMEYLQKWGEIIGETRHVGNVTYYIYTRSWRAPEYKAALERIAFENTNVRINLSTDQDLIAMKGIPSRIGDGLVTYLSVDDTDLPPVGIDLVFRNLRIRHTEPMEYLNGVRVCPYESKLYIGLNNNGAPALEKGKCKPIRCQECRLCIDRSLEEWEAVKGQYAGTPGRETAHKVEAAPANETECLFGAEDLPLLLPSDQEEASRPTSDKGRYWDAKIDRAITRYQSKVIKTFQDAADDGATISPYTRDRSTNTAIVIYQLANMVLPLREEP